MLATTRWKEAGGASDACPACTSRPHGLAVRRRIQGIKWPLVLRQGKDGKGDTPQSPPESSPLDSTRPSYSRWARIYFLVRFLVADDIIPRRGIRVDMAISTGYTWRTDGDRDDSPPDDK